MFVSPFLATLQVWRHWFLVEARAVSFPRAPELRVLSTVALHIAASYEILVML